MAHRHHHHAPHDYSRAFALGVGLNVVYIVVETIYGLVVNSLALLADAGHNLSDVLGLLLAWGAYYISRLRPTQRRTYGWRSSSILAALLNGLLLLVAVGGIGWEAIERLWHPEAVVATTVVWVAALGVVVNGATAVLFLRGRHRDLNIKGAFLHMAADAAISLGVVVAGLVIWQTGMAWIDPLVSLFVAAAILVSTWGLLREALDLILHAVPQGVDPDAVERYLRELPGVEGLHDLHIWGMSTTETALTVHLIKPQVEDEDALLARVCRELHDRFGIEHATVQIERSVQSACRLAPPEVV